MKKIILFCVFVFASTALFCAEITGKVIRVSDGDTISVLDDLDGGNFRIRISGIDAPETKQPFGQKAKQYLSGLIFGKTVSVRFTDIDRYGRIVGRVYLERADIGLAMLSAGFAWHYVHFDKTPEYAAAEKQARG